MKLCDIALNGESGESQLSFALHKPYACPCLTYVEFAFEREGAVNVHRLHAIWQIE